MVAILGGSPTPPPWRIEGDDELGGHPFITLSAGEDGTPSARAICEVQPSYNDNGEPSLDGMAWANAWLIEAAPDLYGALEIALAMGGKALKSAMNLRGQSPYDIGVAALAKARGEVI